MMRSIYFEYYLNLYDYINIEIADSHSFDSDTNKHIYEASISNII